METPQIEALPDVADALIIGAGASGAVAALELARAGYRVVCLEQGDWSRRSDYLGGTPQWEIITRRHMNPNPNKRAHAADYPVQASGSDIEPLMWNGVGGSTILYAAHFIRQPPSDFRVRSLDGVADDWPLTYRDLEPYYARIEQDMGVSGLAGDPAYPPLHGYPNPPLPIGRVGLKAAAGLDRLGWHWWPGSTAIASRPYRGLAGCVRQGTCLTGCPHGAKATTDVTHWAEAIDKGARLVTGARVREISVDGQGRATGAVYIDRTGDERVQKASVVILAANSVGTARLLLLSRSERFPDGLANSSGLVGKRLMMHPYAAVFGSYKDPLESWLGPAGQAIHSMQFYETDLSRGFVRGGKWQVTPTGGPMGSRAADDGGSFTQSWGETFNRHLLQNFGRSFEWGFTAEDLPEDHNCVELDPELTDSDGIPAPRITYRVSDNTQAMIDFNVARMIEAHEAAGAVAIQSVPLVRDCGWHLLGTARMGERPEDSVVNPWGRAHDVPNLYIIDGSPFVTASGVNPTATIMALALRAVDHLISTRAEQDVPSW